MSFELILDFYMGLIVSGRLSLEVCGKIIVLFYPR